MIPTVLLNVNRISIEHQLVAELTYITSDCFDGPFFTNCWLGPFYTFNINLAKHSDHMPPISKSRG